MELVVMFSGLALEVTLCQSEYGTLTDTMSLLKPIQKTSLLIPYEQLLIQTFHQNANLIQEQHCNEQDPFYQSAINPTLRNSPLKTRSIQRT